MPKTETRSRLVDSKSKFWLLVLLLLVAIFNYTDRIVFAVMSQSIKQELGLSDFQIGLVGGLAFALVYSSFGIPIARLADRMSRVRVLSAALFTWSAASALCGLTGNFLHLLLARLGVGMGMAGFLPPTASLLADHFPPQRRASALSIVQLGSPVSALTGGILLAWIGDHWGWRAAFLAAGIPGMILAVIVLVALREPERGRLDGGRAEGASASFRVVLGQLLRKPALVHVVMGGALSMFGLTSIGLFLTPYFVRVHNLSLTDAGIVFGVVQFVGAVSGLLFGGFGADALAARDVRWRAWGPAAGLSLALVAYMVGFAQTNALVAAGFILVAAICLFIYFVPSVAMVQNMAGAHSRATAVALYALASSIIGSGLGPASVGLASDLYANASFAAGDYGARCPGGVAVSGAGEAMIEACRNAAATGIRYALMTCACIFAWAAVHYLLAARTVRNDLNHAVPSAI